MIRIEMTAAEFQALTALLETGVQALNQRLAAAVAASREQSAQVQPRPTETHEDG